MTRCLALFLISFTIASTTFGATTRNDDSCDIGVAPAATLLLPYFEVSVDEPLGETTLFTLTNVTDTARVARVTLWTDLSYPVFSFNVYLTGYDVQSINLFNVLNGRITRRSGTGTSISPHGERTQMNTDLDESCGSIPDEIPALQVERMKVAFTEGVVSNCASVGYEHENAVGYATIDVVGNCSNALPIDSQYFTEDIRFDNALLGDYQQVNSGENSAQGSPMVHIRAIGEVRDGQFTTNLQKTFYGRFQDPAHRNADARQPLPSAFAARWINGGRGEFQTFLKIWRQGVTSHTATCKDYLLNNLPVNESVVFDEDGNGEGVEIPSCNMLCIGTDPIRLPSTSITPIHNYDVFPQDVVDTEVGGWVYLNLMNDTYPPALEAPEQAWVVVSMRAEGRYSIDMNAVALGNGCSYGVNISEFSDFGTIGVLPGPLP